jgi:hypothetical protein
MDLFDTLTWVEILVKTTFLDTPTLTVPYRSSFVNGHFNPEFQSEWLPQIVKCSEFRFASLCNTLPLERTLLLELSLCKLRCIIVNQFCV